MKFERRKATKKDWLVVLAGILFGLFLLVLYLHFKLLLPYITPFIVAIVTFIICLFAFGLL